MTHYLSSSTRGVQLVVLLGLLGTLMGLLYYPLTMSMFWAVLAGYFIYGCLGIVVTFHRKLTHNSYKSNEWLTKLFTIFGAVAGTGSAIAWVAIHINHHLKSDSINDPHAPKYKGWRIFLLEYEANINQDTKWRMRRLISDKFQQFVHRYYFVIIATWSLLLFAIGGVWLMVFGHWAPAVLTGIMSNVVNIAGHKPNWISGYRTYNLNDDSTNSWLFAIPSWGEAWHNNHHRFPKSYTTHQKWWELDISGMIIKFIKI